MGDYLVKLPGLKNCDSILPGVCKKSFQKPHLGVSRIEVVSRGHAEERSTGGAPSVGSLWPALALLSGFGVGKAASMNVRRRLSWEELCSMRSKGC